ncbi:MAG: hypothetical protein NWE83_08255 [Candidatus Bathyarchaeota archaeon]|nr:hypothetical protein [Candidatus Bathyarchaeota archaeon]
MDIEATGLIETLNPGNPTLGCTDDETVMLDFDNTSFADVLVYAQPALKHFRLQGFIILESSDENYHVVFDRKVSWSENIQIVAWVSLIAQHDGLLKWFRMQRIKQSSTLRVSAKHDKPMPRIVARVSEQHQQLASFMEYRAFLQTIDFEP